MKHRFLMQYILHPRTTGAIFPSSKKLACKMIESIDFNNCECIVEFGPGTGAFTEELLKRPKNILDLFWCRRPESNRYGV